MAFVSRVIRRMSRTASGSVIAMALAIVVHGTTVSAATIYLSAQVAVVYPMADGNFVLGFTFDSPSCSSPNSPKYYYVTVGQNGVTADGAKAMLATALTAFALEKVVYVVFDDATSLCYINRLSMSK